MTLGLTVEEQIHSFDNVKCVLANEERFKVKLGIGGDAFSSLKVANVVGQLWDVGGAAGTGGSIAASGTVASSFFATFGQGFLIGTAATPIGWIVGAAVVSGGAYYGVSRLFNSYKSSRVDEIPKFINSGLDVLATSALDLLGSLALKVAHIDGDFAASERKAMTEYFVEEWGYEVDYVNHALDVLEHNISKSRLSDMAATMAQFASEHPDCDFKTIRNQLRSILMAVAEADGHLDEREEMAIERIEAAFSHQGSLLAKGSRVVSSTAASAAGGAVVAADVATSAAEVAVSTAQSAIGALSKRFWPK